MVGLALPLRLSHRQGAQDGAAPAPRPDPGCSDLLPPFPILGACSSYETRRCRRGTPSPSRVAHRRPPSAASLASSTAGACIVDSGTSSLSCFECGEVREPVNRFSRRPACFIFASRRKSNLKMNQLLEHPLETI
jgi:hypothetical protein